MSSNNAGGAYLPSLPATGDAITPHQEATPELCPAEDFSLPKRSPNVFLDGGETPIQLPPETPDQYKPEFYVDFLTEVISHDPVLDRDPDALERFLVEHGCTPPRIYICIIGTHEEKKKQSVLRPDGGSVKVEKKEFEETVTDFHFEIDLVPFLLEGPRIWTVPDNVPAYRGSWFRTTEPDGPVDVRARVKATSEEVELQEKGSKQKKTLGIPPWISRVPTAGDQQQWDEPIRSGRTFREWIVDYCQTRKTIKDFKFVKVVYGWDTQQLIEAIDGVVQSTNYKGQYEIEIKEKDVKVHVYNPSVMAKIFTSVFWSLLLLVLLIYPFLWLWRRYSPSAAGKWDTCGAAFALKRWELAPGTFNGETVAQVRARLPLNDIKDEMIRSGPGGVWILRGTREGEWFRQWAPRIREAIIGQEKHGKNIHLDDHLVGLERTEKIASGLDGF